MSEIRPRPTMADVARAVGLSKNSVSLALRHDPRIPESTRARIEAVASKMGYRKNPAVSRLMTELRCSQHPDFRSSLAMLNANEDARALERHPTLPTYVSGCAQRAAELGYGIDRFWMREPGLNGERFNSILRARGIRGVLVVGLMRENRLPESFAATWKRFPCVVTGVRTREPALSFASTDHHSLAQMAYERLIAAGYQRPALVLDATIDRLVDGRFSAGFHIAQQAIPASRRTRPFFRVTEADLDPGLFYKWMEREKPDAIATLYHAVRRWVEKRGLRVPRDLGVVQLEWRQDHADWAGMDQHNDVVGATAVEMLDAMIRRGESGIPEFPRASLIGSSWRNGGTIQQ